MTGGARTVDSPALAELRETFRSEFARLDARYKGLRQPPALPGRRESRITEVDRPSPGGGGADQRVERRRLTPSD